MYLRDFQRKYVQHFIGWEAQRGTQQGMGTTRVNKFRAVVGDTGCFHFCSLDDVVSIVYSASKGAKWVAKNLSRRWAALLTKNVDSAGLFMYGHCSQKAKLQQVSLAMWYASTADMVALFSDGAVNLPPESRRDAAGLLATLLHKCQVSTWTLTSPCPAPAAALLGETMAVLRIADGEVGAAILRRP